MKKQLSFSPVESFYIGLLLVIFGLISLHAPLYVMIATLFPELTIVIKAWKEILMLIAVAPALIIISRRTEWRLFKDPVVIIAVLYGLLHVLLIPWQYQGELPMIAGLMVDLRYILFFLLVYLTLRLYPSLRSVFIRLGVIGASIFAAVAVLQVYVLPYDALGYIGYNHLTILPYQFVDENTEFVRINSTMRGPNSVGAYAIIVIAGLVAYMLMTRDWLRARRSMVGLTLLSFGVVVALWFSYSRSALGAAVVVLGLIVALTIGRRLPRWAWISSAVLVFALVGGLIAARDSSFVSNVILHENPEAANTISSNAGHLASLKEGTERMLRQPLGGGIGSTGAGSLLGDNPLVIENQYLYIAHESGWLGLGLFIALVVMVLRRLWQRRADWFALAVLASGVGLLIIGVLLPVWVDDTVSVVWWALAAIAIAGKVKARRA